MLLRYFLRYQNWVMIVMPDKPISRNCFLRVWDLRERLSLVRFFGSFGVSSWLCSEGAMAMAVAVSGARKALMPKALFPALKVIVVAFGAREASMSESSSSVL